MSHIITLASLFAFSLASAETKYLRPPAEILEVMRAPAPPRPLPSPTEDRLLLVSTHEYPSIAHVAAPFLKLAGVRVETRNHARHDTRGGYGIPPCVRTIDVVDVKDGARRAVSLAKVSCGGIPRWSGDGRRFAFADRAKASVDLWIVDARTARAARVPGVSLNPMFDHEITWMPDHESVLVKMVVPGEPPRAPKETTGPDVQDARGETGESSTYEKRDVLTSAHDEDLFDFYGRAQLARVSVRDRRVTRLGPPGVYDAIKPAPDGRRVLVDAIVRPYSWQTAYDRFPRRIEVWDLGAPARPGRTVVANLPLADRVPVHGVRTGPREHRWDPSRPATLTWVEALDGGDWNTKVPARDRMLRAEAPFDRPVEVTKLEQRFDDLDWFADGAALVTTYDDNAHWMKTVLLEPKNVGLPRVIFDRSSDEKYLDPGRPVSTVLKNGFKVVRRDGDQMYLEGEGASPAGDRPFLDRFDLGSRTAVRLFRSGTDEFEEFLQFAGGDSFVTWAQQPAEPPNAFTRRPGTATVAAAAGEAAVPSTRAKLTHIPNPTPSLAGIKKKLVTYKRADGVPLSFTLLTPPGYQLGQRVPTILYAYPRDYADAARAGQVSGSENVFTRLRGYRLLLLAGYAIIDQAAFPVVGDPKRAYDTYLDQLVANARAAVDEAVRLGVADPKRIGVTGHSHGALMTANLIAHTDLFRAGVATSGSYNKTLTPFGFQNERRSLWQAPDVYRAASTIFAVDKLKRPLLIVHGAGDANPGTTPMQANFLFEAIRGNGGVARLVMLPHEPHWYAARESNEHLVAEMVNWFGTHLK